jgi:hypothetical protein
MQPDQATSLITDLGLDDLGQEEKDELIQKLAETLQNRLFSTVMQELTDEEKDELNRLSEDSNNERINEYIKEHVPDLEIITGQVYEDFKKDLLDSNWKVGELVESANQSQENQ